MDFSLLSQINIFKGIPTDSLPTYLDSFSHYIRKYSKSEIVYKTGDFINDIGIVLSGSVQMESIDIMGNSTILGISNKGEIFAEAYACVPNVEIMVDVVCREASEILFINVPSLFCDSNSHNTQILIHNLLQATANKNLNLSRRIFHSTPKTIRARLYSYFSEQTTLQNSMNISIPLDRQQLADYLNVDRTALSKELSKMQKEGLISFHKNNFLIKIQGEK